MGHYKTWVIGGVMNTFRLAILETGNVPDVLRPSFGVYPNMFKDLFSRCSGDLDLEFVRVPVRDGVQVQNYRDFDAYLITGSASGVPEELPWFEPLRKLIRSCCETGHPIVGICFGHQLMADALGGIVERAEVGWGCGLMTYESLTDDPDNEPLRKSTAEKMNGHQKGERGAAAATLSTFRMPAFHRDQVVNIPTGSEIVMGSKFCPHAALSYGAHARSVQFHPEFSPQYLSALIHHYAGELISESVASSALSSINRDHHTPLAAGWLWDALNPNP